MHNTILSSVLFEINGQQCNPLQVEDKVLQFRLIGGIRQLIHKMPFLNEPTANTKVIAYMEDNRVRFKLIPSL